MKSLKVSIKVKGYIKRVAKVNADKKDFNLTVAEGTRIKDILKLLNISKENTSIILVNNSIVDLDYVINDNDSLAIHPVVVGG